MIRISDKSLCCGCTACVSACPAQCIVMRRDREGFDYPVANPDLCVKCGLCEKICPVLNPGERKQPLEAYASRCDARMAGSSSGGIFPLLAGRWVADGGIVCGAALDPDCKVAHCEVEDEAGVAALKGSKYAQSELYSMFEDVRNELEEGRKVLFSGTPCQVAGLKAYLGKRQEGLLTVDMACHGVPSPGLWEKYKAAVEIRHGSPLKSVDFRDSSKGWRHYNIRYDFRDKPVIVSREKDPYLALFLQDMTLRPSCYDCRLRGGCSGSDITLSDLWSVARSVPSMNDDRGVSGVLINSEKGRAFFDSVADRLFRQEISAEDVRMDNGGFSGAADIPERRAEFFKGVHSAADLQKYMASFVVRKPLPVRIYRSVRSMLSALKRRMKK